VQNGVIHQVGRNRYYLFINEKPITVEPMTAEQLTVGSRQLEAMRKIVAAHEERIAKLEFELSEFKNGGTSVASVESSDIQVAGTDMLDYLNARLSNMSEYEKRTVFGECGSINTSSSNIE